MNKVGWISNDCHLFPIQLEQQIVATNGNRCDVNLVERTHTPVYWIDQSNEVRRSRWYYSTAKDSNLIPLDQSTDEILEVKNILFHRSLQMMFFCRNSTWKHVVIDLGMSHILSMKEKKLLHFTIPII